MARLLLFLSMIWPWLSVSLAQEPVKPTSESEADRDSAVVGAVLKDLLSLPGSPLETRKGAKKQILFSSVSLNSRLKPSDILEQTTPGEWKKLSPAQLGLAREAARELVRRLEGKEVLKGLKLEDPRIVIWDKAREGSEQDLRSFRRPQVFHAYAPGYSRDQRLAIVRLTFPWSKHSGHGTYVLARIDRGWAVLVRDFVYFL
jgi:hypothetical protein